MHSPKISLILKMILAVIALSLGFSASVSAQTKSYRQWKREQIKDAQKRVDSSKKALTHKTQDPNLKKSLGEEGRELEIQKSELQLETDKTGLQLAKDLSVSDYFAGYLAKITDKNSAFKEVAGKLSAEEVAELMAAYADSVFGTAETSPSLPPSAQNTGTEVR